MERPFTPSGDTVRFAAPGVTSTTQAVPGLASGGASVRVFNGTNQIVNIVFGTAGVVGSPVPSSGPGVRISAGRTETIAVPAGTTHIAVTAFAGSSGDLYITPGFGSTN